MTLFRIWTSHCSSCHNSGTPLTPGLLLYLILTRTSRSSNHISTRFGTTLARMMFLVPGQSITKLAKSTRRKGANSWPNYRAFLKKYLPTYSKHLVSRQGLGRQLLFYIVLTATMDTMCGYYHTGSQWLVIPRLSRWKSSYTLRSGHWHPI